MADDARADLTWIGTATTLLRIGPFTLLTDPNFLHRGELAYLGYGLVSRRLTEPALAIGELPPLDAVLLSHLHGDHWDRRAKAGLDRQLPVVTTTHAASRLTGRDGFTSAVALDTWASHSMSKDGWTLTVTSLPGVHSTNPLLKALLPPVMGSLLECRSPDGAVTARVYVSGDTVLFEGIDEIARRAPEIGAAVVHAGRTTLPGGFVVTMSAADAIECARRLAVPVGVPIHFGDYGVFSEDDERTRAAFASAPTDVQWRLVSRGGTVPLL